MSKSYSTNLTQEQAFIFLTRSIFIQALKEKGLLIKGDLTQSWFNTSKLQINAPQVHTIDLHPDDQVSYVDMNTPASGLLAFLKLLANLLQ